METTRPKLIRLRTMDGSPRYRHSNGWYIQRHKRDYSERGGTRGYQRAPLFWWEVTSTTGPKPRIDHFFAPTLRECRAWCDEHVRVAT